MLVSKFFENFLQNLYFYRYFKRNLNFPSTLIDSTVKILIYIIIDWYSQSNQIIVLCWSGKIIIFDAQDWSTCERPQTVPQSELVSLKHPSCKSLQEDPSDSTRIQDDEFSCCAEDYCGGSDLALCKNLEEEDPMANSEVEEITFSFVSHCTTASESTYPSFSFIVSLVPHCVRLLDSGKLPLANVTKWRTLEARYQKERETCKQSWCKWNS